MLALAQWGCWAHRLCLVVAVPDTHRCVVFAICVVGCALSRYRSELPYMLAERGTDASSASRPSGDCPAGEPGR